MNKQEARSLKEALHATIHKHPTLSVEAIAEMVDMAPSYLYRAALPDKDTDGDDATGVRFPLKKLVPLIQATRDYRVLDYIERVLGRVAIHLPTVSGDLHILHAHLTRTAGEFGEMMQSFAQAMQDGKVSLDEANLFEQEAYETVQEIAAFVEAVRASVKVRVGR